MSFESAGAQIVEDLKAGMVEFAKSVMADSLKEVPKQTGVLARSARIMPVETIGQSLRIAFGYGFGDEVNSQGRTPGEYAVPVHEILDATHPPPTKYKYLEDPLLLHAATLEQRLAASIVVTSYGHSSVVPIQEIRPIQLGEDE